jgi:hypothetical protein
MQSVDIVPYSAYTKSSFWNYSQISKAALFFKPKQKFSKNKQNTNTFYSSDSSVTILIPWSRCTEFGAFLTPLTQTAHACCWRLFILRYS